MKVISIAPDPTCQSILRVKALLNRGGANALGAAHPLTPGLRAVEKVLTGRRLTDAELAHWGELQVLAESICDHLIGRGNDHTLRSNLAGVDSCRALWFEALVLRQVVEPRVVKATWRRYSEGTDIVTTDPTLQFECRLILEPSPRKIIRAAREKLRAPQLRVGDGPFIVVCGADLKLTNGDIQGAHQSITTENLGLIEAWAGRHPELSALLIMLPRAIPPTWHDLGFETAGLDSGRTFSLWVRNLHATDPLPSGFELQN